MVATAVKYASLPGVISTEQALTTRTFLGKGYLMADANSSAHAAQLNVCSQCGEAKTLGGFYFSGGRYAGRCKECKRSDRRKYYREHKEKVKSSNNRWNAKNQEAVSRYKKRWAKNNPGKTLAATQKWREKNPTKARDAARRSREANQDLVRARNRAWRKANREKCLERTRAWKRIHPEIIRADNQRRRASRLSLPSNWTKADDSYARMYFGSRCAACGVLTGLSIKLHSDHWVPLGIPGQCPGTVPSNMVPLCESCNCSKCDRLPGEWLKATFGARRARQIANRVAKFFKTVRAIHYSPAF